MGREGVPTGGRSSLSTKLRSLCAKSTSAARELWEEFGPAEVEEAEVKVAEEAPAAPKDAGTGAEVKVAAATGASTTAPSGPSAAAIGDCLGTGMTRLI